MATSQPERVCGCGCGTTLDGRADRTYVDDAHAQRARRQRRQAEGATPAPTTSIAVATAAPTPPVGPTEERPEGARGPGGGQEARQAGLEFQEDLLTGARKLGWKGVSLRAWKGVPGLVVTGDIQGLPDLILWRDRVLWREVKTGGSEPTEQQLRALRLLREAGQDADVWRDSDLERIIEELR